jgi:hypothetical protein
MSDIHPEQSRAQLSEDTFTAIVVTQSRAHVLAALLAQAVAQFGGGPLLVSNVSVVTCYDCGTSGTSFLAAATISRQE